MVRIPTSTFRLQLHKGFAFEDAAAVAEYLCDLGISHVYSSPYLQAAPGSTHGYDVEAVGDSDAALDSWKASRPDLVLVSLSPRLRASFDRVQDIMRTDSEQTVGHLVSSSLRLSALFFNDVMIRHPEEAEAFMQRVQALFS